MLNQIIVIFFSNSPAAATLSPWSTWSKCQAQSQTRTRSCTSSDKTLPCSGSLQETRLCESKFYYYKSLNYCFGALLQPEKLQFISHPRLDILWTFQNP